ncbi:hypothetical protein BC828DRAFT_371623 [Blastocladiella britannica]|nr:hypothetical protein BC828DRAFT_371623 [Blastocladiella britannica]
MSDQQQQPPQHHEPGWNDPSAEIFIGHATTSTDAVVAVAQDQLHAKLTAILDAKRTTMAVLIYPFCNGTHQFTLDQQDRMFKDSEQRLAPLLERLHAHQVASPLASLLDQVVESYNSQNQDETGRLLQTLSTLYMDEAKWTVGLRRLLS